jgi:hypothetical protein
VLDASIDFYHVSWANTGIQLSNQLRTMPQHRALIDRAFVGDLTLIEGRRGRKHQRTPDATYTRRILLSARAYAATSGMIKAATDSG